MGNTRSSYADSPASPDSLKHPVISETSSSMASTSITPGSPKRRPVLSPASDALEVPFFIDEPAAASNEKHQRTNSLEEAIQLALKQVNPEADIDPKFTHSVDLMSSPSLEEAMGSFEYSELPPDWIDYAD